MIRSIVGWTLGFFSGALLGLALIEGTYFNVCIMISVSTFIASILFARAHHKKKRKEYYSKFN